jgi:hypothetical protein
MGCFWGKGDIEGREKRKKTKIATIMEINPNILASATSYVR